MKTKSVEPSKQHKLAEAESIENSGARPFWCELSRSFYRDLERESKLLGMSYAKLIQESLKFYVAHKHRSQFAIDRDVVPATALNEIFGKASREWWNSLTPEEKRRRAQQASAAAAEKRRTKASKT